MKITIPVSVGKRETLIKSKPSEIDLCDGYMTLKKLYIKERPEDVNDDYSQCKENRYEVECFISKASITGFSWSWSDDWQTYNFEVTYGNECFDLFIENRESVIEYYNKIKSWWLS